MRQRRIIKGKSPIGNALRFIVLRLIPERGPVLCALRTTIDRMEKAERSATSHLAKSVKRSIASLGICLQGTTHLCHPSQDSLSNHVPERLLLRQGNVGGANPAIVKVDGVFADAFGELSDMQFKGNYLFTPQFSEYLLGFGF